MYSLPTVIWVVCEGKSDKAYLAELKRLLRETGTPIILKEEVSGTGYYQPVIKAYNAALEKSGSRRVRKRCFQPWIWVDSDLYERNERDSNDCYRKGPSGIPPFLFSYHNFEDFLVLHLDDEHVVQWVDLCGGGKNPLFERDYLPLLSIIFPDYEKKSLPALLTPLTPALIANAYRHSKDESIPFRCDFIEQLVPIILAKNPDFFG